jgi:hypothetical protein
MTAAGIFTLIATLVGMGLFIAFDIGTLNHLLAKRLKRESNEKAAVVAWLFQPSDNELYIVFENKAEADATGVDVIYAEDFDWQIVDSPFPLERLKKQETVWMKVILRPGAEQRTTISISWDNPDGTKATKDCKLSA